MLAPRHRSSISPQHPFPPSHVHARISCFPYLIHTETTVTSIAREAVFSSPIAPVLPQRAPASGRCECSMRDVVSCPRTTTQPTQLFPARWLRRLQRPESACPLARQEIQYLLRLRLSLTLKSRTAPDTWRELDVSISQTRLRPVKTRSPDVAPSGELSQASAQRHEPRARMTTPGRR